MIVNLNPSFGKIGASKRMREGSTISFLAFGEDVSLRYYH